MNQTQQKEHCGLQDCNTANSEPGAGHHPPGSPQRKKEGRRRVAAPQRPSFQYTSQAYFQLTKQYGITPSMSRRGNPFDNAVAENFFSILKTECIYRHKPVTFSEANETIDRYIHFYNHERIQLKTGEAPLARRLSY